MEANVVEIPTITGAAIVSGEQLRGLLDEALREKTEQAEIDEYGEYERRATAYMVKRRAMPECELSDPCNFQCRACGWNPAEAKIHVWFWALKLKPRQDIVAMSRKMRVTFFRA